MADRQARISEIETEYWQDRQNQPEAIVVARLARSLAQVEAALARLPDALAKGDQRAQDLEWCTKRDRCHIMATGARLVMEDLREALAAGEAVIGYCARCLGELREGDQSVSTGQDENGNPTLVCAACAMPIPREEGDSAAEPEIESAQES